jgi:hypothetical protein
MSEEQWRKDLTNKTQKECDEIVAGLFEHFKDKDPISLYIVSVGFHKIASELLRRDPRLLHVNLLDNFAFPLIDKLAESYFKEQFEKNWDKR